MIKKDANVSQQGKTDRSAGNVSVAARKGYTSIGFYCYVVVDSSIIT